MVKYYWQNWQNRAKHIAMTPNERRAELMRRGIQIKSIALDLGIAAASVSQVIAETKRTPYVREAIARAIERPVGEVFPEFIKAAA